MFKRLFNAVTKLPLRLVRGIRRFNKRVSKFYNRIKRRLKRKSDVIKSFHRRLKELNYYKDNELSTDLVNVASLVAIILAIREKVKFDVDNALNEYNVAYSGFRYPPVDLSKMSFAESSLATPMGSDPNRWYVGMQPEVVSSSDHIKYSKVKYGYGVPTGAAFHNILNVRPIKGKEGYKSTAYQGQTGYYHTKSGFFASFSDPYYGVAQAARMIISYKNAKDWKKSKIDKFGGGKYTIYAMASIFVGESNDANLRYAQFIAKHGNFPLGINTIVNIENDRDQFIKIIQAMAIRETSTYLSDEYLGEVWDAMFKGGTPPLRNILNSKDMGVSTVQNNTVSGIGFNNIQR